MSEPGYAEQADKQQKRARSNRRMTHHRFFFGYAYDLFTHTSLFSHWQNLLAYFRRFRMIALLLRITTLILTVLETGALVILTTAVFLVILPVATALMLGILLTALLESRRTNRALLEHTREKSVCVLFMTPHENPFLPLNAASLAARGHVVIILSPYWISPKGLRAKSSFYCTARSESPSVFLVRKYYFFSLRKRVLRLRNVSYLY